MQLKVRRQRAVRSTMAMIVDGISEEGYREVLRFKMALRETGESWKELFENLKGRGLRAAEFARVTPTRDWRSCFPDCIWNRCWARFQRWPSRWPYSIKRLPLAPIRERNSSTESSKQEISDLQSPNRRHWGASKKRPTSSEWKRPMQLKSLRTVSLMQLPSLPRRRSTTGRFERPKYRSSSFKRSGTGRKSVIRVFQKRTRPRVSSVPC